MGYRLKTIEINQVITKLSQTHNVYAPVLFKDGGIHSDTDMIRYKKITDINEVVFDKKSNFSFKETILPIVQTIFYFTEDTIQEPTLSTKGVIVFLRHCDMHAIKRLDDMYLHNGGIEDVYYKKMREKVKFIVMGCKNSFENCFCVSMNTNISTNYDASIDCKKGMYDMDVKDSFMKDIIEEYVDTKIEVQVEHVMENDTKVEIPANLSAKVIFSKMWDEYDERCIACGRCNFVCPTCTCYTMQDIFYQDNGKVGERKRVHASCMVDGFCDCAGGHTYRKRNGERMRFKVLHKVLDHKKRFGDHMCVGCGRCDDVCPQYISFSKAINNLKNAVKEVENHE